MSNDTITMSRCIYCDDEWIREDMEIVCSKCEDKLKIDLAISSIITATNELKEIPTDKMKTRLDLMISAHTAMGKIIKKIKPRKE
jgi:hypothetical protein